MRAERLIEQLLESSDLVKVFKKYLPKEADVLKTRGGSYEIEGVSASELDKAINKVEKSTGIGLTYSALDDSGWRWNVISVDMNDLIFHRR